MSKTICAICPRACSLEEGAIGFCRARQASGGNVVDYNYGKITALSLDPIEKKPLNRFYPGKSILSAGSFGCNLRCPFCQNHEISMCSSEIHYNEFSPEQLIDRAKELVPFNNIGIALTYNEPLVGYEYAFDVFTLAAKEKLKTVLVTNGYANPGPFSRLLAETDAMNIDLKAFSAEFYCEIGGDLEIVKNNITLAAQGCHLEVTTLIIPGKNDDPVEIREMTKWLSSLGADIPLHLSRFFPRYRLADVPPTPPETIYHLAEIAKEHLNHVYLGNI
ncbi:MAG: AmmeMemoRadiSam system radical SAM enzyme [Christensenellaceae bacterium]|jgi:pyruvate formate lyase activating enzyme